MGIRDWLSTFADEVVRIEEPVSRDVEATDVLLRHPKVPVHFTDLDGYEAVGNLWSTRDRIARAMNLGKEDLLVRILDALRAPGDVPVVDDAPLLTNQATDFDLRDSPVPKFYPKDAGRYITAGVWVAERDGKRNLSFHRILLLDEKRGACRIVPRHLHSMHQAALAAGEELKVAVCIGVDPWNLIGGGLSVEYDVDEFRVASALKRATLGEPAEGVRLRNGLVVPAEAEYVLEGRLTAETHDEGPFVDAVRTYDRVRQEPVLEVDRVYHRDEPIFHAILGGSDEHFQFMGMPREPVIYEGVRKVVPRVHGVRLTEGGCAWLHGVVAITKQHEHDGKNAIMAAFAAHTSMKYVVVVDGDIDIYDPADVEWAIATRFQADRDLVVIERARGSSIDPSADGYTAKMGLDATKPLGGGVAFDKATVGPPGDYQASKSRVNP
jgi:UbiD family decarboxylase